MQLRGATASHVGNVRESNQDRVHFGGYTGVVADGMGGHQGGEMAASIAISEFVDVIDPIAPGGLVELVEDANRAVFEKAADPDLRGMGTTLVALTLRPTEEKISIVNVGDSRAYFLRGQEFGQLTLDHSLVEDLVRQKRLTPEEALTHPQRNILTRALGIASQVEVDRFLVSTKIGDRFLLCSDGLFNEVPEDKIVEILLENPEPNDAADRLVEAALAAAGRDNVTVAVIDVVDDGQGDNVSSEAVETLLVPAVGSPPQDGGPAVEANGATGAPSASFGGQGAVGVDVAEPIVEAPVEGADYDELHLEGENGYAEVDYDEPDYEPAPTETSELPATAPKRRRGLAGFLALVTMGVLAAVGYFGVNTWVERQWYVDVNADQQLAVFQGRPDGFLWTNPTEVTAVGGDFETLTNDAQNAVRARESYGSQEEAEAFIATLERRPEPDEDPDAGEAAEAVDGLAEELDTVEGDGPETNTTQGEGANSESGPAPGSVGTSGGGDEANTESTENTGN